MNHITSFLLLSIVLANSTLANDNLKAFPPAEDGMVRYVLEVPEAETESELMVQLIIGKTVRLDPANRYFFGGELKRETIEGWGYPRYVLDKLGPMAGTLMAVDPNIPKVERFISLSGEPYLIPYNSRLPIVVYVPEGVEVRYSIWKPSEPKAMELG